MSAKNQDKRLEKGMQTNTRILHSAIDIISESGISGITASKLSVRSGVSKSTIFHHYNSIKEVPEAVLALIFSDLLKPLDSQEFDDLEGYLYYLGTSIINIPNEYLKIYRSFFSFYNEAMFIEAYQETLNNYAVKSKRLISKQVKMYSDNLVSIEDADVISHLLLALLDGIGLHSLIGANQEESIKAWELQVKLICRYL
ncbi:TetR/AcrR family transcriptional regulator [Pseudalkalibacillus decolorationis]|uniref:TetR/AcrR family transcriptional regulator n=1 Tax=Pseudalkalibacillus decolorationis TaxID=163879 RepID=UPI0021479670|nr:TetR/AcrR family transcriptional regulator [Pseudalkalibacillus decolorationis]